MLKKVQIMPYFGKKLIFWFFCIWFKVQGRHLSKKVTLKAYPYFENKGGSFKYIFYQKVLRFSCMCSEKVILYKKWSFPFFTPLRMIFQKATLLNIFSKFHLKTILLNKSITKFFFQRFRRKNRKFSKNEYFLARFEVKKLSGRNGTIYHGICHKII